MPFITQGKINWKFLLIVVVLAIIVGVAILTNLCMKPDYHCEQDKDCIFTCPCGCINKESKCRTFGFNYTCEYAECECINNQCTIKQLGGTEDETADWQTYRNEEYGFEITLLDSWEGYSVLEETWRGRTLDGEGTEFEGPQIVIRHPDSTLTKPWQNISIMVFTKNEWSLIEENNLNVSAAPIGPSKLGENQEYIFASPPRWIGFTNHLGQDEAREIIETFEAF
jgi:hypothetical protein